MKNKDLGEVEASELDALKSDIEFIELEDRLEMVKTTAADETRCDIPNNVCK